MKKAVLAHVAQRLLNTPLLITKRKLDAIMMSLGPRLGADAADLSIEVDAAEIAPKRELSYPGASWNDNANYALTPGGTAIIPIHGTLVRRADWLDSMSGIRSYEAIRADFAAALNDGNAKRILLDMASFGGEANDCFDLGDVIYNARSVKPIHAMANDYAFSAGYVLASAAQTICITRVGGAGSIGVICQHCDQSQFDATIGVKYTAIFAGAHKNDFSQHEPLSKDALTEAQGDIDRLYAIFVSQVARNRKMPEAAVRATEASCFYGTAAVEAGLVDQVATFDDFLASLEGTRGKRSGMTASAATETVVAALEAPTELKGADVPKADLKAEMPDEEMKPAQDPAEEIDDAEDGVDDVVDPDDPDEAKKENEMADKTENAAAAPVVDSKMSARIARMCATAGKPELVAEFLEAGFTSDQVADKLYEARTTEQAGPVASARKAQAASQLAELESAAKENAARTGKTKQQAFASLLKANPQAYTEYLRNNPQLDGGKTASRYEA